MSKEKDLISIVIPCYNVEKYVKQCIDSIKKQTYKNIEVLMIDDGAKDDTAKVIKQNIKDDSRFKYYKKKNGGLSDARNYGLKYIKGKYVCFIDSDDWIKKDYVKKLYDAIESGDFDVSICNYISKFVDKEEYSDIKKFHIENYIMPNAWNKMYKSEIFNDLIFPTGKWYEDLGTFPIINMDYPNYIIIDDCLYYYRQNSNSIMNTVDDRIYDIYYDIDRVEKYAKENNYYDKYHDHLEVMNIYHVLIGTIYRKSFDKKFTIKDIKEIKKYVTEKYPNWYKNKLIRGNFSRGYMIYLFFLNYNIYIAVYMILSYLKNRKLRKW